MAQLDLLAFMIGWEEILDLFTLFSLKVLSLQNGTVLSIFLLVLLQHSFIAFQVSKSYKGQELF